jgi:hypothetical protein
MIGRLDRFPPPQDHDEDGRLGLVWPRGAAGLSLIDLAIYPVHPFPRNSLASLDFPINPDDCPASDADESQQSNDDNDCRQSATFALAVHPPILAAGRCKPFSHFVMRWQRWTGRAEEQCRIPAGARRGLRSRRRTE